MLNPTVLFEDNHLLVLNKPNGWTTMGLPAGNETILTWAKEYIKKKYHKPGNVYLGVVSRLDTPVSGLVALARTSKAADRINQQFREHSVEKIYLALLEGALEPEEDDCINLLCEDPRHRKVWITRQEGRNDAKEARLHYRRLAFQNEISLVQIQLETGKKHQIRAQLSYRGFPILGDRKYGAGRFLPEGNIALHARKLTIRHPISQDPLVFTAPLPAFWTPFLPPDSSAVLENEGRN